MRTGKFFKKSQLTFPLYLLYFNGEPIDNSRLCLCALQSQSHWDLLWWLHSMPFVSILLSLLVLQYPAPLFWFSLSISQADIQNICISHLLLIIYFLLSSGNLHGAGNCYVILRLYFELLEQSVAYKQWYNIYIYEHTYSLHQNHGIDITVIQ